MSTIAEATPALNVIGVVRRSESILFEGTGYVEPVDGDLGTGSGTVEARPGVADSIISLTEAKDV